MKKTKTYKTDHPTIKEISIGDRFVTNNGNIVTFEKFDKRDSLWSFSMNLGWYNKGLKYILNDDEGLIIGFNIKQRYITLKDKINLL